MAATTTPAMLSLKSTPILFFARLIEILRLDGTTLRFTDHDRVLSWGGNDYVPALFGASASEKTSGFSNDNLELRGALSSEAIREEEIRAGLYQGAKLTIRVINWMYPFAGQYRADVYEIETTRWNGYVFEAEVVGLGERLLRKTGSSIQRDCDVQRLGDSRCGVPIEDFRVSGEVLSVTSARRKFTTDLTGDDGLYDFGEITFTSGDNDGFTFDVKTYLNTDGEIALQIRAPKAIEVGDEFTIVPGCRRIIEDCKGTAGSGGKPWANNIVNFRGFPDLPGTLVMILTPGSDA